MNLPTITQNNISSLVDQKTLSRGLSYFKSQKVLEMDIERIDDDEILLNSKVIGTWMYNQNIIIETKKSRHLENDTQLIHTNCSCPMTVDCKHCVAVLFKYMTHCILQNESKSIYTPNSQVYEKDILKKWMNSFKTNEKQNKDITNEYGYYQTKYELVYVLNIQEKNYDSKFPNEVTVDVKRCSVLKKGGYGKPSIVKYHHLEYEHQFKEYLSDKDMEIFKLIRPLGDNHYGSISLVLRSDLTELALKKIIETKRAFWNKIDSNLLTLGNPKSANFIWSKLENGSMKFEVDNKNKFTKIFGIKSCWYYDSNKNQIGILKTGDLSTYHVGKLLGAPVIPAEKLQDVSDTLATQIVSKSLPTPVKPKIKIEWINNASPQIHLEICQASFVKDKELQKTLPQFYLKLSFIYNGYTVHTFIDKDYVQIKKKNQIVNIEQSQKEMKKAFLMLETAGFANFSFPGSDLSWFYSPNNSFSERTKLIWFWHDFIEFGVAKLKEANWKISFEKDQSLKFFEAEEWYGEVQEESENTDWFSLNVGVTIDGNRLNLLPIIVNLISQLKHTEDIPKALEKNPFVIVARPTPGQFLKLPTKRILPILETLIELYDTQPLDPDGNLKFSKHAGMQFAQLLNDTNLKWHGATHLKKMQKKLQNFKGIKSVATPTGFNAKLRNYQKSGLSWLEFLREFEFGGILADDMGLGKTVQALALLEKNRQANLLKKPTLIVAPTSLIGNWHREAKNFASNLKVLVLHGSDRKEHFSKIKKSEVVITSYPLVFRDQDILKEHEFFYIILDESQYVKNALSKTARAIFSLKAKHRLCLTGTPMENHLGELWSMFHFLMPGFLGPKDRFKRLFQIPIEKKADGARLKQLQDRIRPFLLRRSKTDVLKELPQKTEITRSVILTGKQRDLYESIRVAMDKKVRDEINKKGLARSHITILDALLKLRQVCCDPTLLSLKYGKAVKESAKLELLMEMVPEMVEEGRRILLFSQFTKMLTIIEDRLKKANIDFVKLTGQTRKRDVVIDRFQTGEVPVFLISLKAGGVGLNLTAADTVIHYDPWWNPAVENQATDRAHRIGQTKKVFVYKLVTEDTVEERILDLQKKKQQLADGIYGKKTKQKNVALDGDELNRLLRPIS